MFYYGIYKGFINIFQIILDPFRVLKLLILMLGGIYQKMLHRFLHSLSVTVYESYLRFL